MGSIYENIQHHRVYPAKIFVTNVEASGFHWHYDYELLLLLKGSLTVYCGPEAEPLGEGELRLFNSKTIHGFKSSGSNNLCLFVQFSEAVFDKALEDRRQYFFYLNSSSERYVPGVPYSHFIGLASRLGLSSMKEGGAAALRTNALLAELAADLAEYAQHDIRMYPAHSLPAEDEVTELISSYIDMHLESPELMSNIYRDLGMSEKSAYRHLKNTLGITVKELIDSGRIEKSRRMLLETDKPVNIIAEECGFGTESTFYRAFKKDMGITPARYRSGGRIRPTGMEVQGYLGFDPGEASGLLKKYAEYKTDPR